MQNRLEKLRLNLETSVERPKAVQPIDVNSES
ncbi:MAG: hypothetical protein RL497_530 [Pseudomonadota bacterium]